MQAEDSPTHTLTHPYRKAVGPRAAAFWFSLSCLLSGHAFGSPQSEDSIHNLLPELEVREPGHSPIRKGDDGHVTVKTKDILRLSRTLGEADLIGKIRSLPLAESNGDYGSGLSVDGSEPGQAQYLINGAPVIFPYRFGGIFSTFNAPHFSSLEFSRQSGAALPPRLGPALMMTPALRFQTGAEGAVTIGMTASSLSVRSGIADRLALSVSGRISYIDKIYGKWLSSSDAGIKYNFHDLNADVAFRPSGSDIISLTFMRSADNLNYDDSRYAVMTAIRWQNTLFNVGYCHRGNLNLKVNAFHSRFADRLSLTMPQMCLTAPASLRSSGIELNIGNDRSDDHRAQWGCGFRLTHDHTIPQWAELEMTETTEAAVRASDSYPQNMVTAIAHGHAEWRLISHRLRLKAETGIGWFRSRTAGITDYSRLIFSPSLTLTGILHDIRMVLSSAYLNQPIHRVGFSELGLASDFWICATGSAPMQRAFTLSANASKRLPWWNMDLEGGLFWSKVSNQTEYQGQVIETIDTEYSPFSHLIVADGCNYGGYASLTRAYGQLTGDISVSYSGGRRHDSGCPKESWAALHAWGWIVKASAVWTDGNHFTFSGNFRLASGRRYTPVEALYIIGDNIAMEYGERNSARLPLYHRLDIGATYSFSSGSRFKIKHLVNLSLINAYGHRNVEMQYFILNSENGDYSLKRLYSLYRFLPSISYTLEF